MSVDSSNTAASDMATSDMAKKVRNLVVVAIASILSIAVVLGIRTTSPAASLSEMAAYSD